MSKELNVIDTVVSEVTEVTPQAEMIKLDECSLALVGGGQGSVFF